MWEPSAFRDLVSGRKRGVGASLLRTALGAAEIPYAWAMRRRNRRYDARRAAVHRVDAAGDQRGQPHSRRRRQNADGPLARPMALRPLDPLGHRQPWIRRPRRGQR